jgi:hypothetical protein
MLTHPYFDLFCFGTLTEEDAMLSPDSNLWHQAMIEEIKKLESIKTWSIINSLPPGRKALKHKWVLKNKNNIFGKYIYKARLTVKGCSQRHGFDFDETFSPVAQQASIRLILSLAISKNMTLYQFDVANAFANADLPEDVEIYMIPPPQMNLLPNTYLRLHRSLYGLKQASREWYLLLSKTLTNLGFKQLISDSCLFTGIFNSEQIILAVYVDDIFVCCCNVSLIEWLHHILSQHFIINSTPLKTCLGLDTTYDSITKSVILSQDKYVHTLVSKYSHYITHIKFRNTPIDMFKLSRSQCPTNKIDQERMQHLPYKQILGALNYLTCTLRADIAFAVHYLARFMDNPAMVHWQQLLNILAYLRDHPYAYIQYSQHTLKSYTLDNKDYVMLPDTLYCFCDADFASTDIDTRRSVTGYCIFFNGGLISWRSSLQKTVSSSSTEAEYKAVHEACKELIWLTHILKELNAPHTGPAYIFEDNTSTIKVTDNPIATSNLKHIDTMYHQTRQFINEGMISIYHIASINQLADIFTKPLSPHSFQVLFKNILFVPELANQY